MLERVSVPAAFSTDPVRILLVPAKGGEPELFQSEYYVADVVSGAGPLWSPDGRYILFNGGRIGDPSTVDWWAAPVSGGPPIRTGARATLRLPSVWQSPVAFTPITTPLTGGSGSGTCSIVIGPANAW